MELDRVSQIVMHKGKAVKLGPTEWAIVSFMVAHPNPVKRKELLDVVEGDYFTQATKISQMRKKLQRIGVDIVPERRKGMTLTCTA